ncbi:MAG: hypothetical protein RLY14_3056, partial [Planctomycetota bacterium]
SQERDKKASQSKTVKLPVTRDTWLSSADKERQGSNGGATKLKFKSYQEMSVVDFDPDSLKGFVIEEAYLYLNVDQKFPLLTVTTSSLSAPWVEGDATGYNVVAGVSSFDNRVHPDQPWSYPGSDFTSVVLGIGNSWWASADATPRDEKGWQQIPVSSQVMAARIADLSYGILVFDDVGSEWKRTGDTFEVFHFPNRYAYSIQQNKTVAPYFIVKLGEADHQAPAKPSDFVSETMQLPEGEAMLTWQTPSDAGPAGTLGFHVEIDRKSVPRYLVPKAGRSGEKVQMRVRDLNLNPQQEHSISIRSVDAAGNVGEPLEASFAVSAKKAWTIPAAVLGRSSKESGKIAGDSKQGWAKLGKSTVAVVDELDKVQSSTGRILPEHPADYFVRNHLWDASKKTIELEGARNEWIAFQLVVQGDSSKVELGASFVGEAKAVESAVGRYIDVPSGDGSWPDPIVDASSQIALSADQAKTPFKSYHVEFYIPRSLDSGEHRGELLIKIDKEVFKLPISLNVWDFALPDRLNFLPEMNAYGLPENEIDYYRLAHQHRTVLNRLPYYHNGRVSEGCAPKWDGKQFDWSSWDERFGPLFDGSAFADLSRGSQPIDCFYLPLFENWPIPIEPNYQTNYWADKALSADYRKQFVYASQLIAEHMQDKGWDQTLFHFYLNGKNNYKEKGWSRSTSPWILDEPAHFQDFYALRWFGEAFREGVASSAKRERSSGNKTPQQNVVYRTDISRPQWQRDSLDGLIQYNVVSSAFRQYRRLVLDRAERFQEKVIEYGTSNRLDQSNVQPLAWCVEAWALGIDGVLPWQTIGSADSWKNGDELSLFYPYQNGVEASSAKVLRGKGMPVPSVRLKGYRRGQQDVEYLILLQQMTAEPRWSLGEWVRTQLPWKSKREGTGIESGEDAGRVQYSQVSGNDFWKLRQRIAQQLQDNPKK